MVTEEYIKQLKTHLNIYSEKDIDNNYGFMGNGKSVYYNLFNLQEVNRIFYCAEDFYSGDILVIFEYKSIYIVAHGGFGSCGVCDPWEETPTLIELRTGIENVFARLEYYNSIKEIPCYGWYSDDIKQALLDFKIIEENK